MVKPWSFKVERIRRYSPEQYPPDGLVIVEGDLAAAGSTWEELPLGVDIDNLECELVAAGRVLMPLSIAKVFPSQRSVMKGLSEFNSREWIPDEYCGLIDSGLYIRMNVGGIP